LRKVGKAKVKLKNRSVELPVYSGEGSKLFVKPRMKKDLPRSVEVVYNGKSFDASLNYMFSEPSYSFKVEDTELGGMDAFDVGRLGERVSSNKLF